MNRSNVIITIGREKGSGGREVGRRLAEKLGIAFYDKELLARAAKESGIDEAIFKNHDEQPTKSLLYSLAMGSFTIGFPQATMGDMPLDHKVFLAQFDAIRKIASEGPCVIVGRCADYALEENPNVISVFILGNEEDKIERTVRREHLTHEKAADYIRKCDKRRAGYHDYYSNKKWGSAKSYNICLNSSVFGINGCVDLIIDAIDRKKESR